MIDYQIKLFCISLSCFVKSSLSHTPFLRSFFPLPLFFCSELSKVVITTILFTLSLVLNVLFTSLQSLHKFLFFQCLAFSLHLHFRCSFARSFSYCPLNCFPPPSLSLSSLPSPLPLSLSLSPISLPFSLYLY